MSGKQEDQCAFDGCTREPLFQETYCWDHLPVEKKNAFRSKVEANKEHLKGANLSAADLSGAELSDADLRKANLHKTNLKDVDLVDGKLEGACLVQAKMIDAQLEGAKLIKANLEQADLSGAELMRTNLKNANLRNANLSAADLSHALLLRVNISGARFFQTGLTDTRLWGIYEYRNARFEHVDISSVDWRGSPLLKRYVEDEIFVQDFRHQHRVLYWLWKSSCDCGRNVWWWIGWSGFIVWFFGSLFLTFLTNSLEVSSVDNLFAAYYFSIVTFTTLGFGDVTPLTLGAQIAVVCEVILGYVMLGGLVSLLAVRLARRA